MDENKIVLCGANAYEKKYYFNEEQFKMIPDSIKQELHVICVLFTEEVGGVFTIAFEEDGKLRQYEGGYTDYSLKKLAEEEEKAAEEAAQTRKTGNGNGAKTDTQTGQKGQRIRGQQKLKFTYQEQKDYETIEADIAALEEKIGKLDEEMAAVSTDFVKLNQLTAEKEETEKLLEEKMDRWMYLAELAARIAEQY